MSGVLVLGAAGLLGRAVLAEAGRSGPVEAVVGSSSPSVHGAHVLRLSSDTVDALAGLLGRLAPTTIVNCTGRTAGTADELHQANVESVRALLEAMRRAVPGARLVHLGSAAEYAEIPHDRTSEDASLGASSPYAASKLAAFRLVSDARNSGLETVVARVFNPIGPGMPDTSLPGHAARLLREASAAGATEVQLGPLDAVRDYVDLRDIASAIGLLATEPRLSHPVYNVGTGRPTAVRDLVGAISSRVGFSGAIVESAPGSPRSPAVLRQVADVGRLTAAGWQPSVDLEASVDALVESVTAEAGRVGSRPA